MIVLGIDPGTGRCGWAVMRFLGSKPEILDYGCLEYPSSLAIPDRLVDIEANITVLINKYSPDAMAIETLMFNRNITTAMQVAEARGVINLCAAKCKLVIQDVTPLQVKMTVAGYGRADKAQIKQMIKLQLGLQTLSKIDDAIDALAVAITGRQLLSSKKLFN